MTQQTELIDWVSFFEQCAQRLHAECEDPDRFSIGFAITNSRKLSKKLRRGVDGLTVRGDSVFVWPANGGVRETIQVRFNDIESITFGRDSETDDMVAVHIQARGSRVVDVSTGPNPEGEQGPTS